MHSFHRRIMLFMKSVRGMALLAVRGIVLACLTSVATLGAQERGPDPSLRDLPLVEVPARGANAGALVIFLSGDGGWAEIDKVVSDALAARGIGVVGMDARS